MPVEYTDATEQNIKFVFILWIRLEDLINFSFELHLTFSLSAVREPLLGKLIQCFEATLSFLPHEVLMRENALPGEEINF